ncbi:MAG: phosphogluconate dehydrogenase (NAD(+)-dependent, decarboxylating) [Leptospirales bacterium]
MRIGMIGLGRIGASMVLRLIKCGHCVVGYDPNANIRQSLEKEGMIQVEDLPALIRRLRENGGPVLVWMMIPSGPPVEGVLDLLLPLLREGDVLVDGGNSHYTDTVRRGKRSLESGVRYVDSGTTGGTGGEDSGFCLMLGGDPESVQTLDPILRALSPPDGYLHVGPPGSGHFVKMVHDGIESALIQAYGEGFDLLKNGPFDLDLPSVAQLWSQGSAVRSWLLELLRGALKANPTLSGVRGFVEDSGAEKWAAETAIEYGVFSPLMTLALMERFASRQGDLFSNKVRTAMRQECAGHRTEPESIAQN